MEISKQGGSGEFEIEGVHVGDLPGQEANEREFRSGWA